jgi:hypothetical protein
MFSDVTLDDQHPGPRTPAVKLAGLGQIVKCTVGRVLRPVPRHESGLGRICRPLWQGLIKPELGLVELAAPIATLRCSIYSNYYR